MLLVPEEIISRVLINPVRKFLKVSLNYEHGLVQKKDLAITVSQIYLILSA